MVATVFRLLQRVQEEWEEEPRPAHVIFARKDWYLLQLLVEDLCILDVDPVFEVLIQPKRKGIDCWRDLIIRHSIDWLVVRLGTWAFK